MAVLSQSTTSRSSSVQPQLRTLATPEGGPILPDAAAGSQRSLQECQDGTPLGGISSLCLKTGRSVLEIMGYRARRDLAIRTWAVWRFTFSMTLALLQIIVIVILTYFAFVHGEYGSCHWLAKLNMIWGVKLVFFQCYPESWFLYKRLKTRAEPVQGVPVIQLCPPDHATFMNLITFVEVWPVVIWILVQVVVLVVHGKQCYAHAPLISTPAFVILALALVYYLPTTLLLTIRRSRESRSGSHDDIEIGPLPQSKVDRIDLVYYIPPPAPAPAAAARPSGPVTGFRRFGPALGFRSTSDQRPHDSDSGEWENTFQRMPRAFLRIEKHEAQCAICLEEYTAPPRRGVAILRPGSASSASAMQSAVADAQGVPEPEPEPLRWLDCGHVFHRGCIDPYITTGPARCPTCRTPVTVWSRCLTCRTPVTGGPVVGSDFARRRGR